MEQLTWKLRKMEESRRVYEDATSQLGSFLELVSSQLTVSGRWGSTQFVPPTVVFSTVYLLLGPRVLAHQCHP